MWKAGASGRDWHPIVAKLRHTGGSLQTNKQSKTGKDISKDLAPLDAGCQGSRASAHGRQYERTTTASADNLLQSNKADSGGDYKSTRRWYFTEFTMDHGQ